MKKVLLDQPMRQVYHPTVQATTQPQTEIRHVGLNPEATARTFSVELLSRITQLYEGPELPGTNHQQEITNMRTFPKLRWRA